MILRNSIILCKPTAGSTHLHSLKVQSIHHSSLNFILIEFYHINRRVCQKCVTQQTIPSVNGFLPVQNNEEIPDR